MSIDSNKALVKRYFEQVWGERRPDRLAEFWADDFVYHGGPTDLEGLKGLWRFLNAFPDVQFTLEDFIGEGEKVVARWVCTGTHQGEFMGIPATGVQNSYTGITIFRLANSKFVEVWLQADNLSMMQQTGAIPIPETS